MEAFGMLVLLVVVLAPIAGVLLLAHVNTRLKRLEAQHRAEIGRLHERLDGLEEAARDAPQSAEPARFVELARTAAPAVPAAPVAAAPAALTPAPPTPAPAPAAPSAARSAAPPAIRPALPTAAKPAPSRDLESFVGGRVLLVAGVIVVLFGVGFFLKIAIDKGWIGPAGRLLLGSGLGVLALLGGDRLRGRGLAAFGQGLMGAGLGALFLCVHVATVRYGFLGQTQGFLCMGGVAALGAALAVARDAPLLAWLGFFGGELAPALLGRDTDALEALCGWLALLHLGLLAVLWRRAWHGLEFLALAASTVYFGAWLERWWHVDRRLPACLCLLGLLLVQWALGLLPALLRRRALGAGPVAALGLTGLLASLAAHVLLYEGQRRALGLSLLGLAVLFGLSGWALARRQRARGPDAIALGTFGLAALATAVPVLFDGRLATPAWAFAGAAALSAGVRLREPAFRLAGAALVLVAGLDVLLHQRPLHDASFMPFFNGPFLAAISPGLASLWAAAALRRARLDALGHTLALSAGAWFLALLAATESYDSVLQRLALELPQTRADLGRAAAGVTLGLCALLLAVIARRQAAAQGAATADGGKAGAAGDGPTAGRRGRPLLLPPLAAALVLGLSSGVADRLLPFVVGFNPLFGASALVGVLVLLVAQAATGKLRAAIAVAGILELLFVLSTEIHAWGELCSLETLSREEARFVARLATSAAWALSAAGLVALGFLRRRAELRWMGLLLFALTLAKVFLGDMASLQAIYRVGSFLILGVLLVAASYLYHRKQREGLPGN